MIGQSILHYRVTEKLGEGGMGEVYLATDTKLDRHVALKFLPEALSKDREARERLIREAKAASRLNHKNILTVHDVQQVDGHDFIVMEHIEGLSLREWSQSEERSVADIRRVARRNSEYDQAIQASQRLLEIDPNSRFAYNSLAYNYNDVGDFAKSITATNQYIVLAPDEANPLDSRGDLYAFNGKLTEAASSYRDALAVKPDFYSSLRKLGDIGLLVRNYRLADSCFSALVASDEKGRRSRGRTGYALIAFFQGRFNDALHILDEGLAADRMEDYEGSWLGYKFGLRMAILELQEDYEGVIETDRLALEQAGLPSWAIGDPNYEIDDATPSAGLYERLGESARADSILEYLYTQIMALNTSRIDSCNWQRGGVEYYRGNYDSALSYLVRLAEPDSWDKTMLARTYIARHEPAEAIALLEPMISRFDYDYFKDPSLYIGAYYWLGSAYEQSGWTKQAIEKYAEFLDIWKDADEGIRMVDDARERLDSLKQQS